MELNLPFDIASLPPNFGKASSNVAGWGVSAHADVDGQDRWSAALEFDADMKMPTSPFA